MSNPDIIDVKLAEENIVTNDLEDLQLSPLDYDSTLDNDPFNIYVAIDNSHNGNVYTEDAFYPAEYEDTNEMNKDDEKTIKNLVNSKSEVNYSLTQRNCCCCGKRCIMRNMFIFSDDNTDAKNNLMCLKCSSYVTDSRLLKDWEKEPYSLITRKCVRCEKEKSYFRFKNENKNCDHCLLKKKRLRLKIKLENESVDGCIEEDRQNSNSNVKQYVECFCCKEKKIINECFQFYECHDDLHSDKMICLHCSINIKDWRCLKDWESSSKIVNGRKCNRCHNIKSRERFKAGKSGCQYCSLKRRRKYLLENK